MHALVTRSIMYKGIIWSPKREKSVGFVCGQRYSWTKVLQIGLLARGYASVGFPKSKTNLCINKRTKKDGENSQLLAELHCCGGSIGYCEWVWIRHGSLRTTVPSTR